MSIQDNFLRIFFADESNTPMDGMIENQPECKQSQGETGMNQHESKEEHVMDASNAELNQQMRSVYYFSPNLCN